MIVFILLVTTIFVLINYAQFKRFFNFINVFLLMWCIVSFLSFFGFYGLYVPPPKAYCYILTVMIIFEMSALLFLKVKFNGHVKNSKINLKLDWRKINFIALLCTIVLLPFAKEGISLAVTEGFYKLRLSGFSEILYSTQEKLFLINIVQPLILSVSTLSLIELIENKKIRVSLLLSVLNCLLYILIFGGRWILLEFLLLTGIILYDSYGTNIIRLIKNNKVIIMVVLVLVGTIAIITNQRSVGGGDGLIYNLYVYFVGSIHLFGVYISNPSTHALGAENLLFGKEFFGGLLEPIYIIARFFGLDWNSGIETINETTQQFVFVSSETLMNNNVTMIYAFLRDFGLLGLILCPFIIGAVYAYMYKAKIKLANIYRKSIYFYSLSIMPFLLFEWMPARMSIVLVPFFLYILTRKSFLTGKT